MAAKKYTVFCDQCYSFNRSGLGKREADREAVSHMNANGHSTHIIEDLPKKKTEAKTNPPRAGQIMSREVMAVVYRNVADPSNVIRVHGFGNADIRVARGRDGSLKIEGLEDSTDVLMIAESNGDVRLTHKRGKSLWQEF